MDARVEPEHDDPEKRKRLISYRNGISPIMENPERGVAFPY
jgi:hypothetical protein